MTGIAIVGAGFVADYYMATLENYPGLRLVGVWDRNGARLQSFVKFHNQRAYASLSEALSDADVSIIVNLTSPESHFDINMAALRAGKHVYCEKPLAMTVADAEAVVALARQSNLIVCGAPANALSDAFALTRTLLDAGKIGAPRLIYAEMEDGPVFRANWREWRSQSGAPWPGEHEFEIGCTLEHAGYGLSWLVGLFGPVARISSFSATAFPDKGHGAPHARLGADFSVGCLAFATGAVARLTCGLAAPRDRSLTIMGDSGAITVRDLWDDRSPINLSQNDERGVAQKVLNRIEASRGKFSPVRLPFGSSVPYPKAAKAGRLPAYPSQIDFARGIAVQAKAIAGRTRPFFCNDVALHLTELALALDAGLPDYAPRTRFDAEWTAPALA
jgi:predicted dehydrogenase